jgi:hypothetical protein
MERFGYAVKISAKKARDAVNKIENLYYLLASLAIVAIPVRYLWRWVRRVDKAVTNEIPHIHAYLVRICKKLDIDIIDLRGDIESDATHKIGDRERD